MFLAEGFPARGVILPPEHDPDSFVRGGNDLAPLVERAPPLMENRLPKAAPCSSAFVARSAMSSGF